MGSNDRGIFERPKGSGKWWIRWQWNHKRRRQCIGSKAAASRRYAEVKELLRKVKAKVKPPESLVEEGFLDWHHLGIDTVEVTLKDYLASITPELAKQKSFKSTLRHINKWNALIGGLKLSEITAKHAILRRTALLDRGLKPASCNRETEFLRAVLNRAIRDGLLKENPLSKLSDLPEDNVLIRYLTESEEERLQKAMDPEAFELVAIAIETGLRRGELFRLTWFDVDLEDRWVKVREGKAGSSRSLPLSDRVLAILTRRRTNQKSSWVFPNSIGGHLDPANFARRIFKPALKQADIQEFRWHDLRHTFCSRLVMRGVHLQTVMALAGHKDYKTTLRYAHLAPDNLQAAIRALGNKQASLRLVN